MLKKYFTSFFKKSVPTYATIRSGGGSPAWTDWDAEKAVREGFNASTAVFVCVSKRARAISSVPLIAEELTMVDGVMKWVPGKRTAALQMLLNRPNPIMSTGEFLRLMMMHLDLAGNSYFTKVRAGKRIGNIAPPVELWPILPTDVDVIKGDVRSGSLIAKYRLRESRIEIPTEDMLHFAYTNPSSLIVGLPPLKACSKAVDTDKDAATWQKVSLQNRGVPDGVFTLDGDSITAEQWENARTQIREQYANPENARAPWVVARAKWQQMSLSPLELDFVQTRKQNALEICAAYEVPIEIVGVGERPTYSNYKIAREAWWQESLLLLMKELESYLNVYLAPEFGTDIRIRFDTSGVAALQKSYTEKVDSAVKLFAMGVPFNTINEKLELGFQSIEGGDQNKVSLEVLNLVAGKNQSA